MPSHAQVPMRARLLSLLPLLLLAGLVVLQVQQAFVRIGVLRDRQRSQFLNAVERMNSEVASAVQSDIARGIERAQTLAGTLGTLDLDSDATSEALERFMIISEDCVAASSSIAAEGSPAVEWQAREAVLVFRAPYRPGRAESSQSSRPSQYSEIKIALLAEPFFGRVTRFQPIVGVGNVLIDSKGRVVALDESAQPLGIEVGQDLAERFDQDVLAQVLAPRERVRAGGSRLFVSPLGGEHALFLLVSVVPDAALLAKAEPARHEANLVVLVSLLSTFGLLTAGFLFHRANVRERSLRQRSRELERERKLAERMATTERLSALGLLTAGVAHEINNPLEGIQNYLALLKGGELSAAKRETYTDRIGQGLERIRVIVRDLLGFARPGTQSGLFDLRAAVQSGLDLARLAPDLKGCELVLEGDLSDSAEGGPDLLVRGDAGGIGQVVLNLLLNAGRAARRQVSVSLGRDTRGYVLDVEDDGEGIDPEDLPRLFDPFFTRSHPTGSNSSTENQARAGTGLGLSISYSIVQTHGGKISARNRPDGGACFEVILPPAEAADLDSSRTSPGAGGSRP